MTKNMTMLHRIYDQACKGNACGRGNCSDCVLGADEQRVRHTLKFETHRRAERSAEKG